MLLENISKTVKYSLQLCLEIFLEEMCLLLQLTFKEESKSLGLQQKVGYKTWRDF